MREMVLSALLDSKRASGGRGPQGNEMSYRVLQVRAGAALARGSVIATNGGTLVVTVSLPTRTERALSKRSIV